LSALIKWAAIFTLSLALFGCGHRNNMKTPRHTLMGAKTPIPEGARHIQIIFKHYPMTIVLFEKTLPKGALEIYNFYVAELAKLGWRPITKERGHFLPLNDGGGKDGRCLMYAWENSREDAVLILIIKAYDSPTQANAEVQHITINIEGRQSIDVSKLKGAIKETAK
jgi:hypothetical protein